MGKNQIQDQGPHRYEVMKLRRVLKKQLAWEKVSISYFKTGAQMNWVFFFQVMQWRTWKGKLHEVTMMIENDNDTEQPLAA